jgi:hypothetical protein
MALLPAILAQRNTLLLLPVVALVLVLVVVVPMAPRG